MELLFLILLVGLLALWVANRNLSARVDALELRLGGPAERVETMPEAIVAPPLAPPAGPAEPAEPPAPPVAAEKESIGGLFERLVAGRLLIWLGGTALVVAAIFLIRYSIEIGLVTPALRMIAAALFGLLLVALGEYARGGRLLSEDPRIAQALVGAGLAILYATIYGSHVLHGLIGAASASLLMLGVTVAALGLALRHGAPTAIMGLAGGFLTPLLVGDPDAGAVPLLFYLAMLDLAIFLIAWRRGWTWLAAAAVVLSFLWTAWLLTQPAADALAAGGFVILLALAASLSRPGPGRELGLIRPLAIGIVQLALLVARTDLGLPAWLLFGALAGASLALAALRDGFRLAPMLALALALVLLAAKGLTGRDPLVAAATVGTTLLFGGGGLALSLWRPRRLWAGLSGFGLAGPVLLLHINRPDLLDRPAWGVTLLALALGPVAIVWLNRARASGDSPEPALLIGAGAAALLAGAGLADLLPADLVAAGWLALALAIALAARRLGDLALAIVAATTTVTALVRALAAVPELATAFVTGIVGDPVLAIDLPSARDAAFALALPAMLLAAIGFVLPLLRRARRVLPILAGLLAIAALYVGFKQAWGLSSEADFVARGFAERLVLTQALFGLGWLIGSGRIAARRFDRDLLRVAGTALTAFAAVRLIWFDLAVHNPAFVDQWVGPLPIFNLILPQFALSALFLYVARRRADQATRSGFWLVAFLAALIAGVMLLVRQAWQGAILTAPAMGIAEFYTYSLAGLVLSIGLLLAGMRLPDKALRLAGLLLLTATIVKVFLVDASELEGVLRILSFLGLGIALIGIGRLYGPILRAERRTGAEG